MSQLTYPTEPQYIEGGMIDWPRLETRRRQNGTLTYVPVICGVCGKERIVQAPSILSAVRLHKTKARCRSCAPLSKREALVAAYKARGCEQLPSGAYIDWPTVETPPPGVSGKSYTVEIICRCGYRRRLSLTAIYNSSGLCRQCTGPDRSGDANPRWKGGFYSNGYKVVRIPPNNPMIVMAEITSKSGWGKILEHRLVAAERLGRPLEFWEHVHHIDGDKANNAPENLSVVSSDVHVVITELTTENKRLQAENARLRHLIQELRQQEQRTPA